MHIRLLALGSRGDVQPFVALGLGLQAAGYDITLGTTADFKPFVEDYGLPCVVAERDIHALLTNRKGGRKAKWEFFRILLEETLKLAEGAALLVYAPALVLSAPHVAEKLGIPAIPAMLQPFMTPTRDFPAVGMPQWNLGGWYNRLTYSVFEKFVWTFLRRQTNRWRRDTLGLPPAGNSPFALLQRPEAVTLYGFSPIVLPKPAEWGPNIHVTGYWFLPEPAGWQPSPALADFLAAGPAPVYVGFGSMASRDPETTANIVLDALQMAGVRGLIATGWEGMQTARVPDNVMVIEGAPHEWLFPRLAAVVHHGGAGTTAAGLRSGVPSIVVPFKSDQPFWGKRVALLGVGPEPIHRKRLTAEALAAALRQATTDQAMRQRAATVGAQIQAEDGIGAAVKVIGDIAGR